MRNTNLNRTKTYFGGAQIDYVRFFSHNADFQTAWQAYHFVKIIDGQPLFKFAVYERVD